METAKDGSTAVPAFEAHLGEDPFDLILMDLMMPDVNGIEATSRIRDIEKSLPFDHPSRTNPVPIIALSIKERDEVQDECLKAGMSDFLSKPLKSEDVRSMLTRWISVTV